MKNTQGSKDIVRAVNGIQVSGDFTVTRNINGQTVSIYYDKMGFLILVTILQALIIIFKEQAQIVMGRISVMLLTD